MSHVQIALRVAAKPTTATSRKSRGLPRVPGSDHQASRLRQKEGRSRLGQLRSSGHDDGMSVYHLLFTSILCSVYCQFHSRSRDCSCEHFTTDTYRNSYAFGTIIYLKQYNIKQNRLFLVCQFTVHPTDQ